MHRYLPASATASRFGRWASVLLIVAIAGCGGSSHVEKPEVPDEESVASLIGGLSSTCESPATAKFSFVEGAAPSEEDCEKYTALIFQVETVDFNGDTATAKGNVLDRDENPVGTMECVCVREGEEWKIKSVTLP